jgi:hypothetical protein
MSSGPTRVLQSPPVPRRHTREAVPPAAAGATLRPGHCACGGGCPRCSQGGATPASIVPGAATPAPAPAPAAVGWADVVAPRPGITPGQELFRWEVDFTTGARDIWLVQHLKNIWDVDRCDRKPYEGWTKGTDDVTHEYWEAWWIDSSGDVRIPQSAGTPPTGTGTPAGADDKWVRQPEPGAEPTRGLWNTKAELYLVMTLPPEFGIGKVPDARDLAATSTPPSTGLGAVVASREVGGIWSFCDPANHWHSTF